MSDRERLLEKLPNEAREAVLTLLSAENPKRPAPVQFPKDKFPGLRVELEPGLPDDLADAITAAFEAVNYPRKPVLPTPDELTEAQRALVTLLADFPLPLDHWPVPPQVANRRRWLGLDPGGPLEKIEEFTVDGVVLRAPVWSILGQLSKGKKPHLAAYWSSIPLQDQLAIYRDAAFRYYNLQAYNLPIPVQTAMLEVLTPWAVQLANELSPYLNRNTSPDRSMTVDETINELLCEILFQSPVEFREQWDGFIVIDLSSEDKQAQTIERLQRLSTARQKARLLSHFGEAFANQVLRDAPRLVAQFPFRELVQLIIDCSNEGEFKPQITVLEQLLAQVRPHPELCAMVESVLVTLPPLRKLRWISLVHPIDQAGLTDIQKAQCRFGSGNIMGAGSDWVNDEEIEYLEVGQIADAQGNHIYDCTIFMDEDGTFFKANTTEPVAWLCQFRLDAQDPQLVDSLKDLLSSKPPLS